MSNISTLVVVAKRDSNKMASTREALNLRIPKPLGDALRAKAKELKTTATDLVIQGLEYVLEGKRESKDSSVDDTIQNILKLIEALESSRKDSSIETRLHQLEIQANRTDKCIDDDPKQKLTALEQKMEDISTRLAKIEGAIAILGQRQGGGGKRQSYNHIPPQMELQPYTGDNLGRRLGVDVKTLEREMKNLSPKEFESWCRSKDPGGMWWKFENDGFYHPIK